MDRSAGKGKEEQLLLHPCVLHSRPGDRHLRVEERINHGESLLCLHWWYCTTVMCGAGRLLEWVSSDMQKKTHKILTLIWLWGSPFAQTFQDLSTRERHLFIAFELPSVTWNPPLPGNSWWLLKPIVSATTAFEPWTSPSPVPALHIPASVIPRKMTHIYQLLVSGIERGSECRRQQAPEQSDDCSHQRTDQAHAPRKQRRERFVDKALQQAFSDRIPRSARGRGPWAPVYNRISKGSESQESWPRSCPQQSPALEGTTQEQFF